MKENVSSYDMKPVYVLYWSCPGPLRVLTILHSEFANWKL